MKDKVDINILVRFDGDRIGFAINRDKDVADDVNETLRLIAALDMLKDREKAKITKIKSFKTTHNARSVEDL